MMFGPHPVRRGCCNTCDALDFEFAKVYAAASLFEASLPIIRAMCPEHVALVEAVVDIFKAQTDDRDYLEGGV